MTTVNESTRRAIEAFVYREARLADESRYDEWEVGSNFVLYEHSVQATGHLRLWAGRVTHRLRRTPDGLRMAAKKVELVNSTSPLPNLAFII